MTLLLLLLLGGGPPGAALEQADQLAARARAEPDEARKAEAVDRALEAYARILDRHKKDQKLVPRVRRRRASLLKHAGRAGEALAEYDAIVEGRARRKDKARALYDGARLLEKGADFAGAERRLRRALEEYKDVVRVRADAACALGRVLEKMVRPKEAERAYRYVVEHCKDEVKAAIEAYDALALLALRRKDARAAERWLRRCFAKYEKRATRGDRYGAYVSRLLGDMKAPRELGR